MTAVHSRSLEWHRVDAVAAAAEMAVGCTGCLTAGVLKRERWHMVEKEGQSLGEHCTRRVLHDAEGGDAAAVDADGCSGSS